MNMSIIEDISYIHRQTGESLTVCKMLYEKNGRNVELTLQELYHSAKETTVVEEKVDVGYYKAEFEKREKNRKITNVVVKSIFTVMIAALSVFLFYRAAILENPIWLLLYILPISILGVLLLKIWLPDKMWKAFRSFGGNSSANDKYQSSIDEDVDYYSEDDDDNGEEPQSEYQGKTIFDILFNDKDDDESSQKADEEEWEESCEECGEYYDDCECDDCGDEDCENW